MLLEKNIFVCNFSGFDFTDLESGAVVFSQASKQPSTSSKICFLEVYGAYFVFLYEGNEAHIRGPA